MRAECNRECGHCNPHGAPYVREGFEYQDFYVSDDGSGSDGLGTFRRPVLVDDRKWERVR